MVGTTKLMSFCIDKRVEIKSVLKDMQE
jgi:hypothetical protein